MPMALEQFRRWVSRISILAVVLAVAGLATVGVFQHDWAIRVVSSLFLLALAVLTRRALAKFEIDTRMAIDSIERIFIALFAYLVIFSPYPLYDDPELRSWLGILMLVVNLLVGCGVFWFVRNKISEVRALAGHSLST
jgi:uncharacterized membrane protein